MIKGVLTKMLTQFSDEIKYFLDFENEFLILNQLINKKIEIDLIGYQCLNCKSDSEIFRQGFCKKCFLLGRLLQVDTPHPISLHL